MNAWVTPLTTPNDSLIAAFTSSQLCNKVPIGYNGTPKIHPQNCPFPSTITTPPNTPIPRPTPLTTPNDIQIQSAICHNMLCGQTDRPTDRWFRRMIPNMSAPLDVLMESDALIVHYIHRELLFVDEENSHRPAS